MDPYLLLIIALILITTKLFGVLTRKAHLPQVVGAIFAGLLLGPAVLGLVVPVDGDVISVFAEMGVILLLFAAGLETDFKLLKEAFGASLVIALFGVALSLGGGYLVGMFMGDTGMESFFIGVVIASTSVSISIEALHEMGKLKSRAGTAILGAAVIDDILGIVILAVVLGMGDGELSFSSIGFTLLKIVAFFVAAFLLGLLAIKFFDYLENRSGRTHKVPIFALAFCFLLAYFADLLGLADITGAYIAGIILCNSRGSEYMEGKATVLSYMLFTPIFFANIGFQTSLEGFGGQMLAFTALLLLVSVFSKVIGCGLGAKLNKYSNKESIQIGTGMIARGEVSLVIAAKGIAGNLMNPDLFSGIILVVVITVLITPIFLKFAFAQKAGSDIPQHQ